MSEPTDHIFGKSETLHANVESTQICKAENSDRAGYGNSLDDSYEKRDVVAEWHVPSHGKLHKIEFEHGTTSGKRVLWIDGQVINCLMLIRLIIFNLFFDRSNYKDYLSTNSVHLLFLGNISTRLDVQTGKIRSSIKIL